LELFQKALKKDEKNPEIINMIAHSERKLGKVNEAIIDYWKALKLRQKFPEAREYMGEAYIQAILLELETLKSYGKEGEEQRGDLLKAFKEAAEKTN
jgi:tetratricopeptide (TPR) repeat protein